MTKPRAKYIQFSVETNAIDYLAKAAYFIKQTEIDKNAWKWVVICLHGALYGFAISICQGTSPTNVETKKQRLIGFIEAVELCQTVGLATPFIHSNPLTLSQDEKDAITSLHDHFRNKFEHFSPKIWLIEIHGFPQMTIHCLAVIRKMLTETDTFMQVSLSVNQKRKIKSLIYQSKRILIASKLYKEFNKVHTI